MFLSGLRMPCGGRSRQLASPRPLVHNFHAVPFPTAPCLEPTMMPSKIPRSVSTAAAATFDPQASHEDSVSPVPRSTGLRLSAEANMESSTTSVTARFVVPHYVTKPGQQLFLTGSSPELGEWDPELAVPLEWRDGHQHSAIVRLPSSRIVQVKLVLKENGLPIFTEEGNPRDIVLMAVADSPDGAKGAASAAEKAAAKAPVSGPRLDYQIMCHVGNTEATQILRLPVVLPAKEAGDRRVLCKFVIMMDGFKLEARQYPVVVGSLEELGQWKPEVGVKLIRQVGGYWTRRVELPLHGGEVHAKVVICNADGQPVFWEPGTANRTLSPQYSGTDSAMHIFICRWSQPDFTPVVSVPVEYESANKEYVKMLDTAQREIGIMRRAITAKSRQCQGLESELATSRRAERVLREEVSGLRTEMAYLMQEVEVAQQGELSARQEVAEVREQLQQLGENYERQISFLESKLDEMEAEIISLQDRLATSNNGNGSNGNGHGYASENGHSSPVMSRSSWR